MANLIEREITCCFTGHRPNKLPWGKDESDTRCLILKNWLYQVIELAYQDGYRHFLCGMALGCDQYFGEEVAFFRESHPDIRLEAAIPCPGQEAHWSPDMRQRYQKLLSLCDLQTVVQPFYDRGCMLRRDRYMVSRSQRIIAVFNGTAGGTQQPLAYALQEGLEVIRLDPDEL